MKKPFQISTDGDNIVITVKKRRLNLVKNILLELFIIGSVYAPWYTNLMWCLGCEREPALGTFFNTLYFFGAVLVYAFFADKRWNIPCGIFMLLTVIGAAAGITAPQSSLYEGFNLLILPPTWGLWYCNIGNTAALAVSLIFSLAALGIMSAKYFRRKQIN